MKVKNHKMSSFKIRFSLLKKKLNVYKRNLRAFKLQQMEKRSFEQNLRKLTQGQ